MKETKENNDKAAEAASKAGEEVIKAAKKAAAAENGSEEQKAAVEETEAKAEELAKQAREIEEQAEQQRRDQEALNKRMAELTAKNAKKRKEEAAAAAQKEWIEGHRQAGSGELAFQLLNYLRTRDSILNNSAGKGDYLDLANEIETMLDTIKKFETVGLTEDGKKIATVLLQAAGKLRNVQSLIFSGIHKGNIVDKELLERVEKILRTDKRITKFTGKTKEILRNSKESHISATVNQRRDWAKDKDEFDRMLQ